MLLQLINEQTNLYAQQQTNTITITEIVRLSSCTPVTDSKVKIFLCLVICKGVEHNYNSKNY